MSMDIYAILAGLIDRPDAPRFYRLLREHYTGVGRAEDAAAIGHLIEKEMIGNDDATDGHDNN